MRGLFGIVYVHISKLTAFLFVHVFDNATCTIMYVYAML